MHAARQLYVDDREMTGSVVPSATAGRHWSTPVACAHACQRLFPRCPGYSAVKIIDDERASKRGAAEPAKAGHDAICTLRAFVNDVAGRARAEDCLGWAGEL
jgi:hypothetical protein